MRQFFILLIFTLVGFEDAIIAQDSFDGYSWQTLECTGEPVARHEAAFVAVGGKFYLLGGRRIQEVSIFDPNTNTWTSGAKPPIEMHHFQGFSYDGKIYVIGAHTGKFPRENPIPTAYEYNPKTDKWSKSFDLPTDRHRASTTASVYNDKLYIASGIVDGHWDGHVKWFDVYDFKTQTWEILPDAPRARDHATSVICNDKLYLLGGRKSSGSIGKVMDLTTPEIDVFDFKKNSWSTLDQPIPTMRAGVTAVCHGDQIIFTGGESMVQKTAHNEVEVLDTKSMKWSKLPSLIQGRHGTQLISYQGKLYIASGSGNKGGGPELTSIECFSASD